MNLEEQIKEMFQHFGKIVKEKVIYISFELDKLIKIVNSRHGKHLCRKVLCQSKER